GPPGMFRDKPGQVQTNEPGAFLSVDAESTEVEQIAEDFDRKDSAPASVVLSDDEELTDPELADMAALAERITAYPWVLGQVIGPIPGEEDPAVAQLVVPVDAQYDH